MTTENSDSIKHFVADPKLKNRRYKSLRSVLAWTVTGILWYGTHKDSKAKKQVKFKATMIASASAYTDSGKKYVLYRSQILTLLNAPKPAMEQLAIELPCLMGFRTHEVTTWKAEYIDFQHMDTKVYDSKNHKLFTVPLNLEVSKHTEEVLAGRIEGHVLLSRSNRNRGDSITNLAIWCIWDKHTKRLNLPNRKEISPITGRRFFACEWYYKQGLSLVTLQRILRHAHFETTVRYVHSLVFYEDLKADYDRFQQTLMQELNAQPLTLKPSNKQGGMFKS